MVSGTGTTGGCPCRRKDNLACVSTLASTGRLEEGVALGFAGSDIALLSFCSTVGDGRLVVVVPTMTVSLSPGSELGSFVSDEFDAALSLSLSRGGRGNFDLARAELLKNSS